MLDLGKRIVEAVQELPPALVSRRFPKPLRMARERVPPHEQEISIRRLDTAPKLVPLIPRHARNDPLRIEEGSLEGFALPPPHVQDGDFENHAREWFGLLSASSFCRVASSTGFVM